MKNKLSKFWNEFLDIIRTKEMSILPAHLAYYFIISIVPAFTIIFYIVSLFNLPIDAINEFIASAFSPSVADTLVSSVNISSKHLFIFLLAFYVTSGGARSIITASNMVFDIEDSPFIKKIIKSFVITLFLIILITFILVVPLFGNQLLNLISIIGINEEIVMLTNTLYKILKWPITLSIIFIFIKIIYTMGPDEKIKSSYVNKGTLFTTIMWSVITGVYSFYINNIANYTVLYGALSNIVILMLWFWLMSYVFVIGLALNYKKSSIENEKTNTIKLKEIQKRINESKLK